MIVISSDLCQTEGFDARTLTHPVEAV